MEYNEKHAINEILNTEIFNVASLIAYMEFNEFENPIFFIHQNTLSTITAFRQIGLLFEWKRSMPYYIISIIFNLKQSNIIYIIER